MFSGTPCCPASTANACLKDFGLQRFSPISAFLITRFTYFQAVVRPQGQSRSFDMTRPRTSRRSNRLGAGTDRNTPFLRCLRVSNTIAPFAASILPTVSASTSEIRAPVKANAKQNVPTSPPSAQAARTNASRSRATRYFRFPPLSNNEPDMNASLPAQEFFSRGSN